LASTSNYRETIYFDAIEGDFAETHF